MKPERKRMMSEKIITDQAGGRQNLKAAPDRFTVGRAVNQAQRAAVPQSAVRGEQ